jgi:DNA-binding response OmpR family regulator
MVSANSAASDVLHGLEYGANDYIRKPFHQEELLLRVQGHIQTTRLAEVEAEIRLPTAAEDLHPPKDTVVCLSAPVVQHRM